jgi:hypothetical protein
MIASKRSPNELSSTDLFFLCDRLQLQTITTISAVVTAAATVAALVASTLAVVAAMMTLSTKTKSWRRPSFHPVG